MLELRGLTKQELEALLTERGEASYRATQILAWIFKRGARGAGEMSDLPSALRSWLVEQADCAPAVFAGTSGSKDQTRKYLFRLADGDLIETVSIPASPARFGEGSRRRTLCVSSQVGCAYGCRFCASGLDGWKRNLSAGEIVGQVLDVQAADGVAVNNLVFMGMGEPLANFNALMKAVEILNAPWGANIGARHITISTSGLVPQIRKLAEHPLQVRLAVSLHGASDSIREQIMPVNRRYPLEELLEACAFFRSHKKQDITFEYILIKDLNDAPAEARRLARLARGLRAKVNLIPYNTVDGLEWERPTRDAQEQFARILRGADVRATLRREKGHDIAAACGQLRRRFDT